MTSIELYFSKKYAIGKSYSVTFTLIVGHGYEQDDVIYVEFGPEGISQKLRNFLFNCDLFDVVLAKFEAEQTEFIKTYYADRYEALYQ